MSDAVKVKLKVWVIGAEEVMEQPHTLHHIGIPHHNIHARQVGTQFRTHTIEEGTGLLNVFPLHRNGDVLLLGKIVAVCRIFRQNVIVFHPVAILAVASHLHQQVAAKLLLVHGTVKQGDLHQRPHRQGV